MSQRDQEKKTGSNDVDSIETAQRRLNLSSALPSKIFLSFVLVLIVFGLCWALPFGSSDKQLWATGEMSRVHSMISNNCGTCHPGNFEKVNDSSCKHCHLLSEHGASLNDPQKRESVFTHRCVDCHQEHDGAEPSMLSPRESALCVSCHATKSESGVAAVSSWSSHPEFNVSLPDGDSVRRVSLAKPSELADKSGIKLNHHLHLKAGLRGPEGPVNLGCKDCHSVSQGDGLLMQPVDMEKHCSSCHALEFDPRLSGRQVPHGDPDVVYKFLYAEYAKLLLGGEEQSLPAGFERRKPGQESRAEEVSKVAFTRAAVEDEARKAERELFTRTACYVCHESAERSDSLESLNQTQQSKFTIVSPRIPEQWMPGSRFSHRAHQEVMCEDCHRGVHDSSKTVDVLLPKKEVCMECHRASGHTPSASSDCVTCHSYHDSQDLPANSKRRIEEILKDLQ